MKTPKQRATDIIHKYRMLLMDDGEDFGEEILVTELSHKMALIDINHSIKVQAKISKLYGINPEPLTRLQITRDEIEKL